MKKALVLTLFFCGCSLASTPTESTQALPQPLPAPAAPTAPAAVNQMLNDQGQPLKFSCSGNLDGPSPVFTSDCNTTVLGVVSAQCGVTGKAAKITKTLLVGSRTNAGGGCNHTFSVDVNVGKATCSGSSNITVVVEATRGGCLVQ